MAACRSQSRCVTSTVETLHRAHLSANCTVQRGAHQVRKFLLHGVPLGCEIGGRSVGVWSLEEKWSELLCGVRSVTPQVQRDLRWWSPISISCGTTDPRAATHHGDRSIVFPWRNKRLPLPCCQPVVRRLGINCPPTAPDSTREDKH